jgi:4-amino-4-deoxy-L-arabinose transferase-like glycosyltransferase
LPQNLPRPLLVLLAVLILFISQDGLGDRKLANPDEGRYSEISREMALSGDFVTPRLNGLKYFEKPPLQYWATAISFKLLGESEFTARLYTALCGLGCILLMAYTGRRLYDAETGLLTGLVLLSAPYFAAMNEVITLDMGLTFWMTLSVAGFLIASGTDNAGSRRRWLLAAWAGMAGAVLSKGLIGIVFPAAALVLYCVVHRNLRPLIRLEWSKGLALFFVIAAPWFVMVSLRNPEFAQFFFIHEHFERFLTTTHRRVEPPWYFLPILFAGFLPWAIALIPACVAGWRAPARLVGHQHTFTPLRFILLFSVFVLAFFSKSGSKLPAYILPIFPVLGLVIGVYLRNADPRRLAWLVLPVMPLALWGAYAAWQAPLRRADEFSRLLYTQMSHWVVPATIAIALAALIAFALLRAGRKWSGVLVLSLGTVIAVEAFERGYEEISPLQSGAAVAAAIRPHLGPETRLYSVENYEQSLPFYLKRTLTLVHYVDEFELGEKAEPEKYIADLKDFAAAWAAPGSAIAIIPPQDIGKMRALGIAFDVLHIDPRRAAIKK